MAAGSPGRRTASSTSPIIVAVAAAPFVFGFSDQTSAVVRLVGLAVPLALLVKYTSYARPNRERPGTSPWGLKHNAPRLAGRFVARQVTKRRSRPPLGPTAAPGP